MENMASSWHGLPHTASAQSEGPAGILNHRFVYRCPVGIGDLGIDR